MAKIGNVERMLRCGLIVGEEDRRRTVSVNLGRTAILVPDLIYFSIELPFLRMPGNTVVSDLRKSAGYGVGLSTLPNPTDVGV
jgi:hypothetical protein